jgi:glyoxylate carboligase
MWPSIPARKQRMTMTSADVLVDTLAAWGIDTIFGIPGDGINGIMEALRKKADTIRFIQTRHEEAAAFMACAFAKYTGRLGCCVATSGPGGIHLLNGLYDAKLDGAPVVAVTGLQFHDLLHTYTQQDVELAYGCNRRHPCVGSRRMAGRGSPKTRLLRASALRLGLAQRSGKMADPAYE